MTLLGLGEPLLETCLGRQLCRARLGDGRARHRRRGNTGGEVEDGGGSAMGDLLVRSSRSLDRRLR